MRRPNRRFNAGVWTDVALSDAARRELSAIDFGKSSRAADPKVPIRSISAPEVLNEAFAYSQPSSFSRGIRTDVSDATWLHLSGTASVDEGGRTIHAGDFAAQLLRTYRNLTELLAAEGATWRHVVRTTCYLRDIERDYELFNQVRTAFLAAAGCEPLPASTAIQARLCRSDLLVEIEAIAILPAAR